MTLPATVERPSLPKNYEAAKASLARCVEIDECADYADKAKALAVYALQSKDESLYRMAIRIRGRAIRRCGELLQEIEPGQGAREGKRRDGGVPPLRRTEVATSAGLSERQRKTALRVARVPEDQFEAMVEAEKPEADYWMSLGYVAVWHLASEVNRSIKAMEKDGPDPQELLPGFERLQRRYSVERNGQQWLVPVAELTDEEIDAKIAEHRAMAAGHELHARELERFREERRSH